MNAIDIDEFKNRFSVIKKLEYVKSMRKGPTGIGKTLETLLGITENNLIVPDLGEIELKAHRDGSTNLITLFTFNRGAWVMDPLVAVKRYGTKDQNGRLGLYFTMSRTQNSAGLFLYVNEDYVSIRHVDGSTLAKWKFIDLENQFRKKIPALVIVYAESEYRGEDEYFHFFKADYLREPNHSLIKAEIRNETIKIDLRLHDKGTMARNHGTGFRIYEKDLHKVFKYRETIA
jgi:hypothetical protein